MLTSWRFAGSALNGVLEDYPYHHLLLRFLCDRRHTANPLRHSAVTFILCRAFVDALTHHQKQDLPEEEQHLLLTQFRELETLLKRGTNSDISEGSFFLNPVNAVCFAFPYCCTSCYEMSTWSFDGFVLPVVVHLQRKQYSYHVLSCTLVPLGGAGRHC